MADQGNITTPDAGNLNTAARKYAASRGWAMDDGSYPIRPLDNHGRSDLEKAIRAVGRGDAPHNAIRRHIMKRARALGLSELIPDNWNDDGSLRSAPTMGDVERRFTPGVVELRAGDAKRVAGYGAVFNKLSRNLGGFVENVENSAFNKSRSDGWPHVVARYNHDTNMLLGTVNGRTLDLAIDNVGLWYDVVPPSARGDIVELVQRGDVQHSSFAFRVPQGGDEWATTDQGYPLRSLREVQLVDVAPVLDPAYPDATAQSRALSGALASLAEHLSVSEDEVRSFASADELRKFFVRTDTQSTKTPVKRTFGPVAAMEMLAKKGPDPEA